MTAGLSPLDGATPSNLATAGSNPVAVLSTRLSKVALEEIARALGCDDTTASRVRSGERARSVMDLAKLIPLCGLKLVDKDKVCVDRPTYDAMTLIASKAMANPQTARTLIWDEEQG